MAPTNAIRPCMSEWSTLTKLLGRTNLRASKTVPTYAANFRLASSRSHFVAAVAALLTAIRALLLALWKARRLNACVPKVNCGIHFFGTTGHLACWLLVVLLVAATFCCSASGLQTPAVVVLAVRYSAKPWYLP